MTISNSSNNKQYQKEKYTVVIGLEIHAQLLLHSKIFSTEAAVYGAMPNTYVSAITMAHPGTLPKVNKQALSQAIKMGIACDSEITRDNAFARKNYFYPDLPKGYQITQDETPICKGGKITITLPGGREKDIELHRIHVEEDTGKLIHDMHATDTLLDLNRAGCGLMEIVTEPCIRSSEEAYIFLHELRKIVRYLEICDGNMQEGSLRCDVNISVMQTESTKFGQRVEVKNMNSIRNVQLAIEYEIKRQIEELENGFKIANETRTYDPEKGITIAMRTKTTVNEYRYFPDPNLPNIFISDEWLNDVKNKMTPMPSTYNLSNYDALVLTETKELAVFYDSVCQTTTYYKAAANWIIGPVKAYINNLNIAIAEFPISPKSLGDLIVLVEEGKINFSNASQKLYPILINNPNKPPLDIAIELNLLQKDNDLELQGYIDNVIAAYPDKVFAYQNGKTGVLGMFMGEIMKRSHGKVSPKLANELLQKRLMKED